MTIRAIRSFDSIALCVLFFLILLLSPGAARDQLDRLTLVVALPVWIAAWFALRMPGKLLADERWRKVMPKLRLWAVLAAGLIPFVSWWYINSSSTYLLINAVAACYACIAFCYYINEAAMAVAGHYESETPHKVAIVTRYGIMYFFFCSFTALVLNLGWDFYQTARSPIDVFSGIFVQHPLATLPLLIAMALWLLLIIVSGLAMPMWASHLLQANQESVTDPAVISLGAPHE